MKCPICRTGETRSGRVSITLERAALTLVVKNVPAQVCEICGEQYIDETTTASLLHQAEQAVDAGIEVEVRTYRAA